MSILIKTFHRSLHKNGQKKAQIQGLASIDKRDLHPNVRNNDLWIADTFGVFLGGQVKFLQSSVPDFVAGEIYALSHVNEVVMVRALDGQKTTLVQAL